MGTLQSAKERLLKRPEAAKRLGVSASTYRRLIRAGQLREVAIGRARRLPESEIDRFIQAQVIATRRQPTDAA
jgi:excisionase family DNA binding protein